MSLEEQVDSYRPQFRQAYRDIRREASGTYGVKDLKLKESADTIPWVPDHSVMEYVPNFCNIKIDMISETTDIEDVKNALLRERSVGLVVLGQQVSRDVKPSLIVMTTTSIYYVIDPNANNQGLELLEWALHTPGLTLWTTNGLLEADCLFHNYGLKLLKSNAQCCLGLHLQLMTTISALPQDVLHGSDEVLCQHIYPKEALIMARQKDFRLLKFHQLVRTWLSTDNEDIFDMDSRQTIHFDTRPLSLTAKNLILKRCCLVLKLSEALEFYTLTEFSAMNRRVLDCLSDGSHPHTILMKKVMEEDERNKIVSHIYLSHLDEPRLSIDSKKPLLPLSAKHGEVDES